MDTLARQLGNHGHDRRDDIALPHGMLSHPLDVLEDPEVALNNRSRRESRDTA